MALMDINNRRTKHYTYSYMNAAECCVIRWWLC